MRPSHPVPEPELHASQELRAALRDTQRQPPKPQAPAAPEPEAYAPGPMSEYAKLFWLVSGVLVVGLAVVVCLLFLLDADLKSNPQFVPFAWLGVTLAAGLCAMFVVWRIRAMLTDAGSRTRAKPRDRYANPEPERDVVCGSEDWVSHDLRRWAQILAITFIGGFVLAVSFNLLWYLLRPDPAPGETYSFRGDLVARLIALAGFCVSGLVAWSLDQRHERGLD